MMFSLPAMRKVAVEASKLRVALTRIVLPHALAVLYKCYIVLGGLRGRDVMRATSSRCHRDGASSSVLPR